MKNSYYSDWARRLPKTMFLVVMIFLSSCTYMKMNPPPDADKAFLAGNNSCFQATAANMLAGAGYGDGATVQARADDIYAELIGHYGTALGGWTDTALTWWLASTNNAWPANPYTDVTVYGNKTKVPYADANLPEDMGNELRSCHLVGVSISWPPDANHNSAYGGHAITGWGDNINDSKAITSNPTRSRLTDSDRDDGGDVQSYRYDDYTNPNPGGNNSGNGWYVDYSTNHPFIKHIAVLSPVQQGAGGTTTQKVIGSYKIHQASKVKATDLHYTVGTDVEILSYRTSLDWLSSASPTIVEATPRRSIQVDWDLSENPVPFCNWVTITTEFVLPRWNAIKYSDVRFTYPKLKAVKVPDIAWRIDTPDKRDADKIPNVTGGYLVGGFEIIDPSRPQNELMVGEYRFIHQYSFDQDPEQHTFGITGEKGLRIANLRFGHSYGYLDTKSLWKFENWMTEKREKMLPLGDEETKVEIDWRGRLPYPEGEVVPWSKDPKVFELYRKK